MDGGDEGRARAVHRNLALARTAANPPSSGTKLKPPCLSPFSLPSLSSLSSLSSQVLVLAWALGDVVGDVGTPSFLARALHSGGLRPWALPSLASLLCFAVSFATGSSFGTMGIAMPIVGPLAFKLAAASGATGDAALKLVTHCFGSIMGGSLFGNLCSPIADTSILTVLATKVRPPRSALMRHCLSQRPALSFCCTPLFCQCDLGAHIATAAPYVVGVGLLSLVLGDLPVGLGVMSPAAALAAQARALTAARCTSLALTLDTACCKFRSSSWSAAFAFLARSRRRSRRWTPRQPCNQSALTDATHPRAHPPSTPNDQNCLSEGGFPIQPPGALGSVNSRNSYNDRASLAQAHAPPGTSDFRRARLPRSQAPRPSLELCLT